MGKMNWTDEQKKVIDLKNRNLLVSAAAGSGKTAVLVERIIQKITAKKDPVDVNRMLVVTFTEAAASEMKERIRLAIEKAMEENPGNSHLERQNALIHSAAITTIHSFCLSVIRDHFHLLDIDPGFRVAEEGELRLLKQDTLEQLLESYYEKEDQNFYDFVEIFGSGRSDKKIEDVILQVYDYSRSYPQPDKWLNSCIENYEVSADSLDTTPMIQHVVMRIQQKISDAEYYLKEALTLCNGINGPYMYADMIESDLEQIHLLDSKKTYQEIGEALTMLTWKRLSTKKDNSVDPDIKDRVKDIRKDVKKLLDSIKDQYFFDTKENWMEEMNHAVPVLTTLVQIVHDFSEQYTEMKKQRNMIDFNDMEHYALQILTEEKDGTLVPSKAACEYQDFIEEVMIDEYQDSNLVQETILTAVSGCSNGRNNMFMVGDVKQSIYRFRLSCPELFMDKYDRYSTKDSKEQKIDLHKNFRSRREVLESANYTFERLMRKDFGNIEYDENAALNAGADYPVLPKECEGFYSNKTELMLCDQTDLQGNEAKKAEADMIADRIKELISTGTLWDKNKNEYRPVTYKDIVILTRSVQGWADILVSTLMEKGIPAHAVSRTGYFETYEISILMDYLRILDNERQDLPLAAVLTSPFVGLHAKEMAKIKTTYPDKTFYEAVRMYTHGWKQQGIDQKLRSKLADFFEELDSFKAKVPYTPIHLLLSQILDKTCFAHYMKAMPGGSQRAANIDMLLDMAATFESTSYKGLFNFIRYIEKLEKHDVDFGEASLANENDNTIRIMSIHKSKGLEFPIVIAAGMGKQFNTQDIKGNIVFHPEWGIGIDSTDLETRTKIPTFLKKIIVEKTKIENLTEELRVLYVAMTRAEEKLILCGGRKLNNFSVTPDETPTLHALESASSYLDWLLPVVYTKDSPIELRIYHPELMDIHEEERLKEDLLYEDELRNWNTDECFDADMKEKIDTQMNHKYPFKNTTDMKMKFTVSELKKLNSEHKATNSEFVPIVPEFMKEKSEKLKGASRGTAYHEFLKHFDFDQKNYYAKLNTTLKEYKENGLMDESMVKSIRPGDILALLKSDLGKRISSAKEKNKLFREQPFVMTVSSSEIYKDDSSEDLLVQGVIDVFFEEEDGLVLVDYKTDYVKTEDELSKKYHAQLEYYADALEKITGKRVKEKIIYSFKLKKEIHL